MKKIKKIVALSLAIAMLSGMTLTANAATPRNNWCCPGAADIVVKQVDHTYTVGGNEIHKDTILKCLACGQEKRFCPF